MTIGTQPPCSILTTFAARKRQVDDEERRRSASTTCSADQSHRERATTANSSEVIAIVPVTAMPYAALSALEFLKQSDEQQAADHQRLVHLGDVDLSRLVLARCG